MTGAPGPDIGRGIGLAVALAGMQTVQSICQHHFFYRSMMTGAMARSALINVIYRKSLVLSNKVCALSLEMLTAGPYGIH